MKRLVDVLERQPYAPAAYGKVWNYVEATGAKQPVWVKPFSEHRLALRCIVSQPGTLKDAAHGRPSAASTTACGWRSTTICGGGCTRILRRLNLSMNSWALNRDHADTKTQRQLHYREAMAIVREYHGRVPLKWWLAQPCAVWLKAALNALQRS
jgi:hypothetical protein